MKLLFRQRFFSWFDSYDIFDEAGKVVYQVHGELSWGHRLKVYDTLGHEQGLLQEQVIALLPRFHVYIGGNHIGSISRDFTFFIPHYNIDFNGWQIQGEILEWNYQILDRNGKHIASIDKQLLNWTDTYVLNIVEPKDAIMVLMFVLAIDAEKCSRGKRESFF